MISLTLIGSFIWGAAGAGVAPAVGAGAGADAVVEPVGEHAARAAAVAARNIHFTCVSLTSFWSARKSVARRIRPALI
jgi:hypothetical protein